MAGSVIAFRNVDFAYADGETLLKNVNLELADGGFYLVRGPSGAGKSTLLRLINRLEEPSAGTIAFHGRPLSAYPPPKLRRSILYIQQTPTVLDSTVRHNLMQPFTFRNNRDLPGPDENKLKQLLAGFLLDKVGLDDNAANLSVGQQQRLCFIRGLLLTPEVLLLDEPTSALDEESARIVEAAAERLNKQEALTVVMISHRDFRPRDLNPSLIEVGQGRAELRP